MKALFSKLLLKGSIKRTQNGSVVERPWIESSKKLDRLLSDERKEILSVWGGVKSTNLMSLDFDFWRFYKTFESFNSHFVPDDVFFCLITKCLNFLPYGQTAQHKGLYPKTFCGIRQPKVFVNCINDILYDCDYQKIGMEKAVSILSAIDDFIVKPTENSSCGLQVKKIISRNFNLDRLLKESGNNFICQECIKQSGITSVFNDSSLNTFRMTSLYLNGNCTVENILFRHGRNGSIVDNGAAGGIMVGVDPLSGQFRKYGYDKWLKKYECSETGIRYNDTCIREIPGIVNQLCCWHKQYLPHLGVVGWDIAINEQDEPVFIEVNISYPGIALEQLCSNKPIFGKRVEEVIDYVCNHQENLHWSQYYGRFS